LRQFDFYEFAGVVVPGTLALFGVAVVLPSVREVVFDQDMTLGDAAVSVILAYGAGHLIQGLGNAIELLLWVACGGWPSDWPRSGRRHLLSSEQISLIEQRLLKALPNGIRALNQKDWRSIVRQIYASVSSAGCTHRVDVFNGNYGLNRGMAAALLTIAVVACVLQGREAMGSVVLLVAGAVVAVYRMHRFGVHYARELFVQFMSIPKDHKESDQDG